MNKNVAKASLAGDASRPEPTVSPYGERKTDRILTGTPFSVNTKNRPFILRQPLRYQALRKFKQTFVLDAVSGLYIMRHLERQVGAAFAQNYTEPPPIRKKSLLSLE